MNNDPNLHFYNCFEIIKTIYPHPTFLKVDIYNIHYQNIFVYLKVFFFTKWFVYTQKTIKKINGLPLKFCNLWPSLTSI